MAEETNSAEGMAADVAPKSKRKARKERKFPALTFKEALALAEAIQKYAAGQKVRRLTLFEKLDQSPDSSDSRRLITASSQYGLTKGSYNAEYLELTPEGIEATGEDVAPAKKLRARFNLGIQRHSPFELLYQKLKSNKMPAKEVMEDYLSEANVEDDEKAECIDTFILNVTFLGYSGPSAEQSVWFHLNRQWRKAQESHRRKDRASRMSGQQSWLRHLRQVSALK